MAHYFISARLFVHLSIDRHLFLPAGFWDTVNMAAMNIFTQVSCMGLTGGGGASAHCVTEENLNADPAAFTSQALGLQAYATTACSAFLLVSLGSNFGP